MNLTTEQLKAVKEMGNLYLPLNMVAANLEVSELELRVDMMDKDSDAYKAYMAGVGERTTALHDAILRSASNGSNPAQMEALKFLAQIKNDFVI